MLALLITGGLFGLAMILIGKGMEYDERKRASRPPQPRASPAVQLLWWAIFAVAMVAFTFGIGWLWEAVRGY